MQHGSNGIKPAFHKVELNRNRGTLLTAGDTCFLVGRTGISIMKEMMYSVDFPRGKYENSKAVHLDYSDSFMVKNKLLNVRFYYRLQHGLLGDYINFDVNYDGEIIGDYRSLRSYAGGGVNGTWPDITTPDWQIKFIFESNDSNRKLNHFSIRYFETIVYN